MISIIVGTTFSKEKEDNLDYLELFVSSLKKNTSVPYELLVWDNGVKTGRVKKFCKGKARYFESTQNIGITKPYNFMVKKAIFPLIFLADDDYYMLPNWDILVEELKELGTWRAPIRIERRLTRRTRGVFGKFGNTFDSFREDDLLNEYKDKVHPQRCYYSVLPAVFWKQDFLNIGGYNENFWVGEDDLAWRFYLYFLKKGKKQLTHPKSFLYHFGSKSKRTFDTNVERKKMENYCYSTYGKTCQEIEKTLQIFEPYKPSFDENGNFLVCYD